MKVISKFLLCICFIVNSLSIVNAQTWLWANNITGTTANDDDRAVACDASNNIYVAGTYQGTMTFDATHTLTAVAGVTNFYIVKYDQNKNFVWVINGVSSAASVGSIDFGRRIVFDNSGYFYVTGYCNQTLIFGGLITITPLNAGINCGFILKVSTTGTTISGLRYATVPNAAGNGVMSESMAIDQNNNLTISGNYVGTLTLSGGGSYAATVIKNHFIVQYSNSYTFNWAKIYTSTNATTKLISIINCTNQGYYVGGFVRNSITIGATTITSRGGAADDDIILIKLDNSGNTQWIRHAGSSLADRCNEVCSDKYGNAYITGYISGTAGIGNTGNFDSTGTNLLDSHGLIAGAYDAYVAKYNSSGLLQWIRQFGGANNQIGYGILANDSNLAVTGSYIGNFTWNNTITTTGALNIDAFLGTMDFNGNAIHCLSANGSTNVEDRGEKVAWDNNGSIYISGFYNSSPLSAGNFFLTPVAVPDIFLLKAGTINITGTKTNISCNGGNNGAVNLTVTGGTPTYTYSWSNSDLTKNISGLTYGTYTVTVTDANLITATQSFTLTQPALINLTSINTNPSCAPGSDGSIDLLVSGGTSPYLFNWGGGNITVQDSSKLIAGSYSVTVTDANLCTAALTVNLINSLPPSVSLTGTNPSCIPGNDGTISTTVLGGASPYTFKWSDEPTITQNRSNLVPGNYTVTVTDSKGCTQTGSYTLLNLQPTASITAGGSTTFCSGGSVLLVANGGSGYTYKWQNPAGTNIAGAIGVNYTATISGSYVVVVTNPAGAGCNTTSAATVVTVNPNPTVYNVTGGGNFCAGTTKVISLSGSQSGVNYQLQRNGINTGAAIAGTGAAISFPGQGVSANYTVIATNATTGCTSTMAGMATLTSVAAPAIPTITPAGSITFCNGSSVVLNTGVVSGLTYIWLRAGSNIPGANGSSYKDTSSGNITVRVTNNNGCSSVSSNRWITVNTSPQNFIVTGGGTFCTGASGTITLSNSIIGENYQLLLNGNNQGSAIAGTGSPISFPAQTSAGIYTVVATIPASGCTATMTGSATITLNPVPPAPIINPSGSVFLCSGNSVPLSIPAVSGITYIWTKNGTNILGANSSSYTTSDSGQYSVFVTNNFGCSNTSSLATSVIVNSLPSIFNVTGGGIKCPGILPDDIVLSGSTLATISYQLLYIGLASGPAVTGTGGAIDFGLHVNPGTYNVLATNTTTGCTATMAGTAVVGTSTSQPVLTIAGNNPSCSPGNDGSATAIINNGTPPFSYFWMPVFSANPLLANLNGGTYSVTITDASGCTASDSITLFLDPPSITLIGTNPTCTNPTYGSVDLIVTNGTLPFSYNWNNTSSNKDITSLSAGTYIVTVTDSKGCTVVDSTTLTNPAPPSITLIGSNPSCNPGGDGSINLIVSGGEVPYSYFWLSGAFTDTTEDLSGLAAGTYFVTVTDINGCTADSLITLTKSVSPSITLIKNNPSCNPGSDGSIHSVVIGGTPGYFYNWLPIGANTDSISNLNPGPYSVTVTDSKGCQSFSTTTINASVPPIVSFVNNNPSCNPGNDGSINPVISGGTAPYAYLWSWSGGLPIPPVSQLLNLTISDTGTYYITVTDSKGCTATGSTMLTAPISPVLTFTESNPSCNPGGDGNIDLIVSQGTQPFTYNWENNANPGNNIGTSENITSLSAGTYNVTVTDSRGCINIGSASLSNSLPPSVSLIGTNPNCSTGGVIHAIVSGGNLPYLLYQWSGIAGNTDSISGLSSGSYSVTVTDNKGCTATGSTSIIDIGSPSVTLIGTNPTCPLQNDGSIHLIVTGGTLPYSYSWNTFANSDSLTGLAQGDYSVTVTDYNGCKVSGHDSLFNSIPPVLAFTTDKSSCFPGNDGTINLIVSGGEIPFSFIWSNGKITENLGSLSANTYFVTVTDNKGCTATGSAIVDSSFAPSLTLIGNNPGCALNNGSIDLIASQGTLPYSYLWSNTDTTEDISGLSPGPYNVIVTDSKGCSTTGFDTLFSSLPPSISFISTNPGCSPGNDGIIDLNVSGGSAPYTFSWSNDSTTENLSGLDTGTYFVTVTDNKGCIVTGSTSLIKVTSPSISLIGINPTCVPGNDGTVNLMITGGTLPFVYNWNNALFPGVTISTSENIYSLSAGKYNVTVTDSKGCTAIDSTTIFSSVPPSLTLIPSNPGCSPGNDGTIDLIVTDGTLPFTYSWSNDSITEDLQGLPAGVYTVTVTDNKGCIVTGSSALYKSIPPSINLIGSNPGCSNNDGSVSLFIFGGILPYSYIWSPSGDTTKDLSGLQTGTYNVTVTDAKGCTADSSITLINSVPPSLNFIVSNPGCNAGSSDGTIDLIVSSGQQPFHYLWSENDTTEDLSGLIAGTYIVTVTDAKGCTAIDSTKLINSVPPSLTFMGINPTCNPGGDGSINLIVNQGTQPFIYHWENIINPGVTISTNEDLYSLSAGIYNVTVTDSKGCVSTGSDSLQNSFPPSLSLIGANPGCPNWNDGTIYPIVNGGTSPYLFVWSNGPTSENISGLTSGSYSLTVTDEKGCIASDSIILVNANPLSISLTGTNPNCSPVSDGAINLSVSGGNLPYVFTWSNGMSTENISGLDSGIYSVTVTDSKNCSVTGSFKLNNAPLPSASLIPVYPSCIPGNDGEIDLIVSGGTVPYSYLWSNSATTEDLYHLPSSSIPYVVTVTDANGCTAVGFSILTDDIPTANITTGGPTSFCAGNSVNLIANPGADYSYQWQNPSGTNIFDATGIIYNASSSGNYVVVITNSSLCSATSDTITVVANQLPVQFNVTGGGNSCISGTGFNIGLDSSEAGVSYELYFSGNPTGVIVTPNISGPFNFPVQNITGNFTIVATSNNCNSTMNGSATITYFSSPSASIISLGSTTICSGESVQLSAGSGSGYTYQWQNPAGANISGAYGINYTASTSGNYVVIETNSYGCKDTSSVLTVNVTPLPEIYNVTGGGSSCITGSSFTIGLDNGDTNVTYELYLAGIQTGITVTPIVSGAFNFPSQSFQGTYTVVATYNGCTSTMNGSATINYLSYPVASITAIGSTSFCSGGSVQLTATSGSGYTYQWQNPAGTNIPGATGISYNATLSGNYIVIVTNSNGCADTSASILVNVNPLPNIYNVTGGGSSCVAGTSFTIGLNNSYAGVSYELFLDGNPTGITVSSLVSGAISFPVQNLAGTYTVVATDSGCISTMSGSATITYYSTPVSTITTVGSSTFCTGGSVQLTATSGSGYIYQWQNPVGTNITGATDISYNATTSGKYVVIITNAYGCSNTSSIDSVTVNPLPNIFNVTGGGSSCTAGTGFAIGLSNSEPGVTYNLYLNGSPTGLTMTSGFSGQINFPFQNLAGIYTIVASSNGCSSTMSGSASITYYTSPVASITATSSTSFCTGGNVGLVATSGSGFTYQWQSPAGNNITGATDISYYATATGNYVVIVTNSDGCSTTSNPISVTENLFPTQYNVIGGGTSCINGTPITIGLNNGNIGTNYELYLNGNPTGEIVNPVVAGLFNFSAQSIAGTYTVVATGNGCSSNMNGAASISYFTPPISVISPLGSTTFCSGGNVQLTATSGSGYTYQWQNPAGANIFGATGITYNAISGGNYAVVITSPDGCSVTSVPVLITTNPLPDIFNVSGGGNSCINGTPFFIGLDSSDAGVSYELYLFGSPTGISQTQLTSGPFNFSSGISSPGNYTIVATSPSLCSSTMNGSATINYLAPPSASINAGGPTNFCAGNSVVLTANNATGYTYQWLSGGINIAGATNFSYTATLSGSYSVQITNSEGCSSISSSIDVTVNPLPVSPTIVISDTNNICSGYSGNITLSVPDGDGDNLSWLLSCSGTDIGAGTPFVTPAPTSTTTYYARWETSCGISSCATLTIIVNYLPTIYNVTGGGNSCIYGDPFSIGLSNSDSGVTYQLYRGGSPVPGVNITASSAGAFNFVPDQSIPGNYSIVATNTNLCSSTMNGITLINYYPVPVSNISVNTPTTICSGDSVILYANALPGLLYQWYQGGISINSANNPTFTAFTSGQYSVAVTNSNGCSSTSTDIIVTVNSLPLAPVSIIADTNNICANYTGNIILYASAGIGDTLKWSTSCFGSTVGVGTPLIISNPSVTTTYYARWENSCGNSTCSSVIISVGALPTVFNVIGGGNSCIFGTPFTISLDSSETGILYQLYRGGFPIPGDSITSTSTGPVIFHPQTIADFYSITATNSFGCTSIMNGTARINYFYSTPANINALGNTTICSGDSVILHSNTGTGFLYQWVLGGINISGASDSMFTVHNPGSYTVIITNNRGCTASSPAVDVTVNPTPLIYVNALSPICVGQTSTITFSFSGTGPFDINLTQQQNGLPPTNVTLSNINGPFYSFAVNPTDSTTYTITSITDNATGCTKTTLLPVFVVKVNQLPSAIISISDTSECFGNQILVAAKLIGRAPWNVTLDHSLNGNTPVHIINYNVSSPFLYYDIPLAGTNTYSFKAITDANGCTNYNVPGSVSVIINPLPNVFNFSGGGSTCDPSKAFIINMDSSQTGVTYQLIRDGVSVAGSVISPDTAGPFSFPPQNTGGNYSVQAILGNCASMMAGAVSIVYLERTIISLDVTNPDCMGSENGSINIKLYSGIEPFTYFWNDSSLASDRNNLVDGTYSVTVTGSDGCTDNATAILIRPVKPVLTLTASSPSCILCNDGSIYLSIDGGTEPFSYSWSNNMYTPNLENLQAGHYVLTVADQNGCVVKDSADLEKNWRGIQIYNAFTPNGDGVNDVWNIKFLEHYPNCVVKVFDQWGIIVFSSKGYAKPWDGKKNGNLLPAATYYYIIDLGDGSKAFTGSVNIIK